MRNRFFFTYFFLCALRLAIISHGPVDGVCRLLDRFDSTGFGVCMYYHSINCFLAVEI